ncbi:MAG: hypothetical protein ACHQKZ_06585 [Solirubrobacterales bacterium]
MNRFFSLVARPLLAGAALVLAVPVYAQGPYLKLRADQAKVQPPEAVKLTLTAVSGRTLALPAPVVFVDEGDGFRARPDLTCTLAAGGRSLTVTPEKAVVASCDIKLDRPGKSKVRLEYRLPSGLARTNTVTLDVQGPAAAQAVQ